MAWLGALGIAQKFQAVRGFKIAPLCKCGPSVHNFEPSVCLTLSCCTLRHQHHAGSCNTHQFCLMSLSFGWAGALCIDPTKNFSADQFTVTKISKNTHLKSNNNNSHRLGSYLLHGFKSSTQPMGMLRMLGGPNHDAHTHLKSEWGTQKSTLLGALGLMQKCQAALGFKIVLSCECGPSMCNFEPSGWLTLLCWTLGHQH